MPIALLLSASGLIFNIIGQDEKVSDIAVTFIRVALPHVLFTEMFDIQKHQLNCYRLSYIQMSAQITGTLLHIPIMIYLVNQYPDAAIIAIGAATSISSFLKLVAIIGFGLCHKDVRESWVRPSFRDWSANSKTDFMSIGLPSMVMFCAEGWAFQVLTLLAGLISIEDQAVQAICAIVSTTLFMFGSGLQEASSSLIGNMIGANKVGLAWHYAQILSAFTVIFALLSQVPLFVY